MNQPQPPVRAGSSGVLKWLLVLLVLLILAGGGYYYWTTTQKSSTATATTTPTPTAKVSASPLPSTSPSAVSTADWKTYTNAQYKFSFKYPRDWISENIVESQYTSQGVKLTSPETVAQQKTHSGPSPLGPDLDVHWYADFASFSQPLASSEINNIDDWLVAVSAQNILKSTNPNGVKFDVASMQADPSYSAAIAQNTNGNIVILNFGSVLGIKLDTVKSVTSLTDVSNQILSTFQFTK